MSYFTVGDCVTLRSDLEHGRYYGENDYVRGMGRGTRAIIKEVMGVDDYKIDGSIFRYSNQMFEEYMMDLNVLVAEFDEFAEMENVLEHEDTSSVLEVKVRELEERIIQLENTSTIQPSSSIRKVVNLSQDVHLEDIISILGSEKWEKLKNAGYEVIKRA